MSEFQIAKAACKFPINTCFFQKYGLCPKSISSSVIWICETNKNVITLKVAGKYWIPRTIWNEVNKENIGSQEPSGKVQNGNYSDKFVSTDTTPRNKFSSSYSRLSRLSLKQKKTIFLDRQFGIIGLEDFKVSCNSYAFMKKCTLFFSFPKFQHAVREFGLRFPKRGISLWRRPLNLRLYQWPNTIQVGSNLSMISSPCGPSQAKMSQLV